MVFKKDDTDDTTSMIQLVSLSNYFTAMYRTLNEWESVTLEHLLGLSQQIIQSNFDNPIELYSQLAEVMELLHEHCQRYEFYRASDSKKVIVLAEFLPE